MQPVAKTFAEFRVGDTASFTATVMSEMIAQFAQVSGDTNPLHTSQEFAHSFGHPDVVMHGMLGGALFSQLVGMHLPGLHALYLSQSLNFRKPIYPGTEITVKGEVVQIVEMAKALKIKTSITSQAGETCIDGEAMVKVLK